MLIEELDKMDRKVIVVFYGDHLPGLYTEFFDQNNSIELATTPYFVYSNFSEARLKLGKTQSLTIMNNLVKDLADVKVNAFDSMILSLRSELPAARFEYFVNNDDKVIENEELTGEQEELMKDYYYIQYDLLEGKSYTSKYLRNN